MRAKGGLVIEVALTDHSELEKEMRAVLPHGQAELRYRSEYRDFAILEIALSSLAAGVVGIALDTLKVYVKNRLSPGRTAPEQAVSIRIGEVSIQVPGDTNTADLDTLFARLRDVASVESDDADAQ